MTLRHALLVLCTWLLLAGSSAAAQRGDYYNRGNAHARSGEWGLAMLDYQRARLQHPEDRDLAANLRYVQAEAKLSAPAATLLDRISRTTTPDVAAGVGLFGLAALGAALLSRRRLLRVACLLLGVATGGFAVCHALALRSVVHSAVVIRGPASVQASPVPMADEIFTLPEADTVQIKAARPDYLLVTDRRGKVGWVSRSRVEPVVAER